MNSLVANVTKIANLENLNLVNFDFNGETLSMMSLELDEKIKVGSKVNLRVKASHLIVAKDFQGQISLSNILKGTIKNLDIGKILTSIKIDIKGTKLSSIITSTSAKNMNLKAGDRIQILIKASDLYINELIK